MLIPPTPTVMVSELATDPTVIRPLPGATGLPTLIISLWVTASFTLTAALVISLVLQGGTRTLPAESPRSKANPPTMIAEATSPELSATVALMPDKSAVGKPADGSTATQPSSYNRNLQGG